jgi:hypothetical protein
MSLLDLKLRRRRRSPLLEQLGEGGDGRVIGSSARLQQQRLIVLPH